MGYSSVAVIHHDMTSDIAKEMPRLAKAMREIGGQCKVQDFGVGRLVSFDHASGPQVVVVKGNTGWRIGCVGHIDQVPPDDVLEACAAALRAHGWAVKPPKKTNS